MPGKRVSRVRRRSRRGVAVTVVAAALLAVLAGWSVTTLLSAGDDLPGGAGLLGGGNRDRDASTAALLESCAYDVARADEAVTAGRAGIDGWQTHLQARTDMLAGTITEAEMENVWDRTRLAGPDHVRRFDAAVEAYDGVTACERFDGANVGSAAQQWAAEDCTERARAADRAVTAAQAALREWTAHLRHMEEFRDGGMTVGHAQHLWIAAWRKAPANIDAFDRARAVLDAAPRCVSPKG